jgi:hypothetical protein
MDIYIEEFFSGQPTDNVLRIKEKLGAHANLGSICFRGRCGCGSHLDLKENLIAEIDGVTGQKNAFLALPANPQDGALRVGSGPKAQNNPANRFPETPKPSACWGGRGYVSWREYPSVDFAIKYLKRYFTVHACAMNVEVTQEFIDKC